MTEPPDWQPPAPAYGAPQPYGYPPPGYGAPPPPYGAPPPPYGAPPAYGYPQSYGYGWPGQIRATGKTILLVVCTLGIYIFVYNYKVHDEMKRYSGRGVGGGIALLLTFVANFAMPFVTPAEVGSLYSLRGERPPVNGWTGLWFLLPYIGGYILMMFALFAVAFDTTSSGTAGGIVVVTFFLLYFASVIAGSVIWFVKTNGALNRFWESVGVPAAVSRVA
jgi:hypothetical protein